MINANDLTDASGTLFIPIHEELYILWIHSNLGLSIQDWIEEIILERAVEAGVWKKERPMWLRKNLGVPYLVPNNSTSPASGAESLSN